jgi:hypothetical protein
VGLERTSPFLSAGGGGESGQVRSGQVDFFSKFEIKTK